jgi:hypothetical protein
MARSRAGRLNAKSGMLFQGMKFISAYLPRRSSDLEIFGVVVGLFRKY